MRNATQYVKQNLGTGLMCAEIGVKDGENAKEMLDVLPISKVFLIDPYMPYERCPDEIEKNTSTFANNKTLLEGFYLTAFTILNPYKKFIEFIKVESDKASKLLKDVEFDFVYMDGNHTYEFVKNDLKNWYPLIKKGGVLAGHDAHFKDVIGAVMEFKNEHEKEVTFLVDGYDWIMKKL